MWQRQVFAAAPPPPPVSRSLLDWQEGGRGVADACAYGRRRTDRRRYEVGPASGPGAAGTAAGGDDDTDAGVAAAVPSPAAQVGSRAAVAS